MEVGHALPFLMAYINNTRRISHCTQPQDKLEYKYAACKKLITCTSAIHEGLLSNSQVLCAMMVVFAGKMLAYRGFPFA